jgi:hypothetical protein
MSSADAPYRDKGTPLIPRSPKPTESLTDKEKSQAKRIARVFVKKGASK